MQTELAPWIRSQLRQLLVQRGHAWLLQGPSGLGQYTLALELARAWLCEQPHADGACGTCASCHAVDVRTHADLMALMPEVTLMQTHWPLDEKAQAEIDDKKRKPSKEIRVEAMRQAVEFAQRTSSRGRDKVVLVYPAEQMNGVTANALLKTLEEPAGLLRFVLASSAPESLLPTIRSRCQPVPLGLPPREQALAWLAERGVASPEVLLDACGGRPQQALQWSEDGSAAKTWLELPRRIARNETGVLSDWPVPRAIEALQRLATDLIRTAHGAPSAYFPRDALPAARNPEAMQEWARILRDAARHADHPLNAQLLMESLVGQGQRLMRVAVRKDA